MNLDYVGKENILGRAETDFTKESKATGTQSKMGKDAFFTAPCDPIKASGPNKSNG